MLIAILLFIGILSTIVFGIATPILKQVKIGNDIFRSKQSYFLAEAGIEDAMTRLNAGKTVASGDTVTIDGQTATITMTSSPSGRVIESLADYQGANRKMRLQVIAGIGVSFNYAVQTGNGGFIFSNNAGVNGNVYANGNIQGASGAFVTGSAVAANSISLVTDQTNDSPLTPPNNINFRNTDPTQDTAQSFKVSVTSSLNRIQVYLKKVGSPSNITMRLVTDNAGAPSTNVIDTATINSSLITTNYGWIDALSTTNVQLTAGTTYWIILDNSGTSASNYYVIGGNSSYVDGNALIGQYAGTWNATSPAGLDTYFKVYLGGLTSTISDVTVGTGSIGDARAYNVTSSTVSGSLYCKTGSGNNKVCNTSLPDPVPQPFPISDANIQQWKDEGEAGGTITGNHTQIGGSIGPKKITGNLTLSETVTITGTLWVEGNISMTNNAIIKLISTYGADSGTIITDGYIILENNVVFQGSGTSGSFIMIVTTSDCPVSTSCGGRYALDISNNVESILVNAQRGTVRMSNNASAKGITAYKLFLENNAVVTYESGLANVNFSSGPGGSWNIISWKEIE